ncbi:MAG: hypothetical protein CMF62_03290 [Magnetococcales bacterium]|nr:hypothetical protein [Magnetococcales bacterium]|tara:strand:+ start:12632 stop:15001 length:2370 start_codon:yes stop_codon:yes gene_type:complete
MEYVKVLTGKCDYEFNPKAYVFNPISDDFQNHGYASIDRGENVLVTAHTGSGKTRIGIYGIAHFIRLGKKVIYTTPVKALSNQKYKELKEFSKNFYEQTGYSFSVGIMTGDNKLDPDADVLVVTTEILRNALFKLGKEGSTRKDCEIDENMISNLGCVIFDEVHYINDKDRGHVWEETLCLLESHICLILLSATIANVEDFAKKIGNMKKKVINLISTDKRVVPLNHYIFVDDELNLFFDENNTFYDKNVSTTYDKYKMVKSDNKINDLIGYMQKKNLFQTIFFSFSRKNCERYAELVTYNLLNHEEIRDMEEIFNKHMHSYKKQYEHVKQYHMILKLLRKGICVHHAGLIPILKEIIEIIFKQKLIKVLFATETFAVGVNNPTRSIVFTELDKPTKYGRRDLQTAEYKQMSGRAGRRGIDKTGTVIVLPLYRYPYTSSLKQMVLGNVPSIKSKFKLNYLFILKIILSQSANLDTFISNTIYHQEEKNALEQRKQSLKDIEDKINNIKLEENKEIEQYIKLIQEQDELLKMNISLSKKKKKNLGNLQRVYQNDPKLLDYEKLSKLKKEYNEVTYYIENNKEIFRENIQIYLKILKNHNYLIGEVDNIDLVTEDNITIKGIVASQINECNSFILTEIIDKKILHNLTPQEIVGFLAIFIKDIRINESSELIGTDNLNDKFKIVEDIIKDYQQTEYNLNIVSDDEYWGINYEFVDCAYSWADGNQLHTALSYCDMFEGDFVKRIIKISNIVKDLRSLCKIYGDLEIIPVLEEIDELLLRDIVNVNSLYIVS